MSHGPFRNHLVSIRPSVVDNRLDSGGLRRESQPAAGGISIPNLANLTPNVPYINPNLIPNIPHFDMGSGGFEDFGMGTLAVLHGREAVVTASSVLPLNSDQTPGSISARPIQVTQSFVLNGPGSDEKYVRQVLMPAMTKAAQAGVIEALRLKDALDR